MLPAALSVHNASRLRRARPLGSSQHARLVPQRKPSPSAALLLLWFWIVALTSRFILSNAGKAAQRSFAELLESVAARVDSCFVCGASGQASTSGQDSEEDEAEDDSSSLAFTVLTSISFKARSLCLKQGGVSELTIGSWCCLATQRHAHMHAMTVCMCCVQFACEKCRALRSTQRFLQFSALRLGPEHEDR